ncbi:MAG: hypothetical protein GYB65_15525 [Chloroflexi bacterium]|nr:hypothetical protein [Chloroflexota bacterium]
MKILAVSDVVLPQLQDAKYLERTFADVNLIISCGDMPPGYLDFLSSILNVPLFFVRGNHDGNYKPMHPGGDNLHMRVVNYGEFSFAGIEGSVRYNNGPVQFTEREMRLNVLRLMPALLMARRRGKGVDVMVTHNPPQGIHDIPDDHAHRGFEAYLRLMRWARPRYLIHGHIDTWDRRKVTQTVYENTTVININPYHVLDLADESGTP